MADGSPNNNPNPHALHAGLDPNGEMRIGDTFTFAARGDSVEIRGRKGRTKTIPAREFEDLITEKYFGEY